MNKSKQKRTKIDPHLSAAELLKDFPKISKKYIEAGKRAQRAIHKDEWFFFSKIRSAVSKELWKEDVYHRLGCLDCFDIGRRG